MKKVLIVFLFALSFCSLHAAPFAPNNIVVLRVGDGAAALSNAGQFIFLDEYTSAGTLVQSIQLPVVLNGANKRFVISGSATSEGFLILSPNKQYLSMAGYDTIPGVTSVASTAGINRVIAMVNYLGNINTTTSFIDGYLTNNVRSAVTLDGTSFWVSGAGSSNSGGVRYITMGGTTSTQVSTSVTNTRVISIFNGQLLVSASSGAFLGVNKVGSGLPTIAGETITNTINAPSSSSYGFAYNSDTSVCYIADDRSLPNGGVQKWTRSGAVWSLAYTLNAGLTKGCRGLAVNFDGANPVLYAVMDSTVSNKVLSVTDNGASSPFTAIITAGNNQLIRGIAFTPVAPPPPMPLAPTPVLPANNSTGNLTSLNLVWNRSLNAASYRVQLATDISFTNIVLNDSTLTDSLRSVSGLLPLTDYWWRVNAKNVSGTSAYSTIFKFRTLGVPAQITGTFVPASGSTGLGTTVNFRWPRATDQLLDNPTTISNYWFELTTDTVAFTNLTRDSLLTDTTRTSTGLTNSVTYFWRVKAKNQSGWGAFSQWLRFVTSPLSISATGEIPDVFALYNNFPNPFNPITTIGFDIPKHSFVSLRVFDILGREVTSLVSEDMEPGSYKVSFDASSLSSGLYFYRINAGGFTSVKKMLLIK